MWNYLTKEKIIEINKKYDPPGVVINSGALSDAVVSPQRTYSGHEVYPDVEGKVYALARAISQSHPFRDGNKRTATESSREFLIINGFGVIDEGKFQGVINNLADEDPIEYEEFCDEVKEAISKD